MNRPVPQRPLSLLKELSAPRMFAVGAFRFVFANAGIMERANFYEKVQTLPPPKPEYPIIDISFKGFVHTAWLAQHYFRATPEEGKEPLLLFHSSFTAFAATVNYMRYIAFPFDHFGGLRTRTICLGGIKTNVMTPWGTHGVRGVEVTPMAEATGAIKMLIDGKPVEDS
ncbi:hypothetical protein DL765_001246 [Monosporascus sp. GIB2]|nr:hypothetical protein DL765_001246 [Monosporascus sp. GIB2]